MTIDFCAIRTKWPQVKRSLGKRLCGTGRSMCTLMQRLVDLVPPLTRSMERLNVEELIKTKPDKDLNCTNVSYKSLASPKPQSSPAAITKFISLPIKKKINLIFLFFLNLIKIANNNYIEF